MNVKIGDKVSWDGKYCRGIGFVSRVDSHGCCITFDVESESYTHVKEYKTISLDNKDMESDGFSLMPMNKEDYERIAKQINVFCEYDGNIDAFVNDLNAVCEKHGVLVCEFLHPFTLLRAKDGYASFKHGTTHSGRKVLGTEHGYEVTKNIDKYNPAILEMVS